MELTPLRAAGLIAALVFAARHLWAYRRGKIGNGDLLLRLVVFVLPLLVVSLEPGIFTWFLDELSFRKGGGRRILGARPCAVAVLYAFSFILASRQERTRRDLTRLIENLALEQFRATADVEEFAGGIAVVIPAYNEAGNIAARARRAAGGGLRAARCTPIVVDDGSADDTDRARARGGRRRRAAAAEPRPGRRASHGLPARAGDRGAGWS